MGNIKVLVRDLGSVNFDKICRLALSFIRKDATEFYFIEVVNDDESAFDIDGADVDREYWKRNGRSMTELYAIRSGLGTADASGVVCVASDIPGLVSLCEALAENHGKVPGKKGGSLYKKGMIPSYARELALLPDRASEILGMLVKAVAESLKDPHPIAALIAATDDAWDEIDDALAEANRAVYEEARKLVRSMTRSRVIHVPTRNAELAKHLWSALKSVWPDFAVAAMVVSNPETGRIAILTNHQLKIDVRPLAKALTERFPESGFDVNADRGSVVFDPRSQADAPVPSPEKVVEIVSASPALLETKKVEPPRERFGATLADRFGQKRR